MFKNLTTEGLEKEIDYIPGSGSTLPSGYYEATIKALYAKQNASGSMGVTLLANLEDGKEYKEMFTITNREGHNYYDFKGKKSPLGGFTIVNDICLVASGKPLNEQDTEDKVFKIYDYDLKEEVPTTLPTITALAGEKVGLVIRQSRKFRQALNSSTGKWEDTEDTYTLNEVIKVVYPNDRATVSERSTDSDAVYTSTWLEKFEGQLYDRTEGKAPSKSTKTKAPKKSLFSK